jgi:hypothetical protein
MSANIPTRRGSVILYAALAAVFCLAGRAGAETETRTTEPFTAVSFGGSWSIEVTVGKENSVTIEGSKSALARVKTEVVDGELRIGLEHSGFSLFGGNHDTDGLVAHVTVPKLTAFALQGSGDAKIVGLDGGAATLALSGSGDLKAKGRLDVLTLVVNGSGDADLKDLVATKATATVNGSGDATVHPTESLAVIVNGSGQVTYVGEGTKVTSVVHGSGTVEKQ